MAAAIKRSKRPVIYSGGGVMHGSGASAELRELVRKNENPSDDDADGPGGLSRPKTRSRSRCSACTAACMPTTRSTRPTCCLAFGVRFDDRVTGKVSEFAKHGKIVHIDIDPSEMNKNKEAHIPIVSDIQVRAGRAEQRSSNRQKILSGWHNQIAAWKKSDPFQVRQGRSARSPRSMRSIKLWELTKDMRHDRHGGRRPASDVGSPTLQTAKSRAPGARAPAWARWVLGCPPRWAPRRPIPTNW